MYIRSVKFKNMFAYGNHEVFIPFDVDPATFWQVLGKNGVGKSSFIKIIKIGLYHELEGLKIDEVAHQINKNGFVEINVDNNGSNWLIQTTFSPYNIKVFKNGSEKPEDWGGKDDIKKKIKQEISTIPYHIFNNTISLSVNDFKSFLTMTPKDARDIRDRIFGFFIFNQMAEDFKKENSSYNKEYSDLNGEINVLNEQIIKHGESRDELIRKIQESKQESVDQYNVEIQEIEKSLLEKETELAKKQNTLKVLGIFLNVNSNKAMQKAMDDYSRDLEIIKQKYDNSSADSSKMDQEIKKLVNERNLVFNKQLKAEIEKYEINLLAVKNEKDIIDKSLQSIEEELLQTRNTANKENRKLSVNSQIDALKLSIGTLKMLGEQKLSFSNVLNSNLDALKRQNETISYSKEESIKLNGEKNELVSKIKLFDEGKCGSCGSDLTTNEKLDEKHGFQERLSEIDGKLGEFEKIINANIESKVTIEKQIENDRKQITENSNLINSEINKLVSNKKSLFELISLIEPLSALHTDKFGFIDSLKLNFDNGSIIDYSDVDSWTNFKYVTIERDYDKEIAEYDAKIADFKKNQQKLGNEIISTESTINTNKSKIRPQSETDDNLQFNTDEEYNVNIESKNKLLEELNKECNLVKTNIDNLQMNISKCQQSIISVPDNVVAAYENSAELGKGNLDFSQREQSIKEKISNVTEIVSSHEMSIKEMKTKIEGIIIKRNALTDEKNYEHQLESIDKIIANTRESIDLKTLDLDAINKKILNNDMILYSLGDEGIKAFILKNIIPSINYEVSQYLQTLGIPLEVSFNELFEVTVKRFGIDANLKSISTGQTKMIDCCILLAITKILKMKYTDVNLVFYDEVFSSLDSDNRPIIIEMFYKVCCEILKMNVFMMGHFYIPISHESKVIEIKSDTRFSELNVYKSDDYMRMHA